MYYRPIFEAHKFRKKTNVKWAGRKPVFHYVYHLEYFEHVKGRGGDFDDKSQLIAPNAITIYKSNETPSKPHEAEKYEDVVRIAQEILETPSKNTGGPQNIDIYLNNQCWLIIEIDRSLNWRYSRDLPAVTTRIRESAWPGDKSLRGFNVDLIYVFDDGTAVDEPKKGPVGVDCHLVLFRVVRRVKGLACKMNFSVDIYGPDSKTVVPLIIDPQVPEDPPQSFP